MLGPATKMVWALSGPGGPNCGDTARLSQRYPSIARYGVFGVSTWPIGCDTPSPFSEHFPRGEHAKWRCDTPPSKRGISAILARYPMKTRQMGAIPPSAILSRKGIARYGGGISHWAAKSGPHKNVPPCLGQNARKNYIRCGEGGCKWEGGGGGTSRLSATRRLVYVLLLSSAPRLYGFDPHRFAGSGRC